MQQKSFKRYAKKLTVAIKNATGVDYTSNTYDWVCAMKQLEKRRGYAIRQIRDVVYWYATAISKGKVYDNYLPQVFTSDDLLQKFDRLVLRKKELEKEPDELPETDLTEKQIYLIKNYITKLHEYGNERNFETKDTIDKSVKEIVLMYEDIKDFETIEEHLHWLTCRMVQEWDWCPGIYKGGSFRNKFDEVKKRKRMYEKKFGVLSLSARGVKVEDTGKVVSQEEYLDDLF